MRAETMTFKHKRLADLSGEDFQLLIQATSAANPLVPGAPVPEPSISSSVLRTGLPRFEKDAQLARDYHPANPTIYSEIVYPLATGGRTFGVLNFESKDPKDERRLAESDGPLVAWFARLLGLAAQTASLRDPIQTTLDDRATAEALFSGLLDRALDAGNRLFCRGLGYRAEYQTGFVRVVAWHAVNRAEFEMPFDEPASMTQYSATRAVRTGKTYFSRFPKGDRNIHQTGLELFAIKGSLVAVPVRLPSKLTPVVLGALVLWAADEIALLPEDVKKVMPALEEAATLRIPIPGKS